MQIIEKYVPVTQAKTKFLDMVRELKNTDETIAITKNGIPEAVVLSMTKFNCLLETIDILSDSWAMEQMHNSAKDIKAGRLIDPAEVF
jgi:antitoxin YefM